MYDLACRGRVATTWTEVQRRVSVPYQLEGTDTGSCVSAQCHPWCAQRLRLAGAMCVEAAACSTDSTIPCQPVCGGLGMGCTLHACSPLAVHSLGGLYNSRARSG